MTPPRCWSELSSVEREVSRADRRQLSVLQDNHSGTCNLAAEIDLYIGADLRHLARQIAETGERRAIAADIDRINASLEVGDRVGAVASREGEAIAARTAREHVVARPAVQDVVTIAAIEDEPHGRCRYAA